MRRYEFGLIITSLDLYNGRRSLYVALMLGKRTYWLQRWDLERDSRARVIEHNREMSWSWGVR